MFECTGAFTLREDLEAHVRAGARYVILSAPSTGGDVETIVHGVNGVAVRVPVAVGSLADIVALASRRTTVEDVNRAFTEEADSERHRSVLGVSSSDGAGTLDDPEGQQSER